MEQAGLTRGQRFRGNYPATIDGEGRLKIPSAYRRIFLGEYGKHGRDLYVTSVNGKNVRIYSISEWERIEARLLESPKMQPAKLKFLRNTNYYGQLARVDSIAH